jgi:hypothetical protein
MRLPHIGPRTWADIIHTPAREVVMVCALLSDYSTVEYRQPPLPHTVRCT